MGRQRLITLFASFALAFFALPALAAEDLKSLFKSETKQDDFLQPDQAFHLTGDLAGGTATLTWDIAKGYYLYRDRVKITSKTPGVTVGTPTFPPGIKKHDEFFGDMEVYHDQLVVKAPLTGAKPGAVELEVSYQGCAEAGLCYNPQTKTLSLTPPPAAVGAANSTPSTVDSSSGGVVSEQDKASNLLRTGSLLAVLASFFVSGFLLSFTPCVLPMIPILSGIIVGQGDKTTPARSFALAMSYVQGMALTYAAAGVIFAAIFGQQAQAFFQKPWILASFAALFVVLATSMFGAFTLELPSSLQTRLSNVSNQQKAGTFVGTFVMGALSSLIVTACVAPVLVGALSVVAQSGMMVRGGAALYAMGLGMGVPLLAVGASAGSLLPRAGAWMDTVKQLFGVVFIGMAIYIVGPILPAAVTMALWAALAVLSGYWIFSLQISQGTPAPAPLRGVGLLAVVYGVLLLIGASSGRTDPLQPLQGLGSLTAANESHSSVGGTPGANAAAGTVTRGVTFKLVRSVADLDRELAQASSAGKSTMLDFYADWCTSCKEMEKYSFSTADVRSALQNTVLLQADVTANSDDDQALLHRFGIFGPPTIAFFGSDGAERKNFRVVGFMPAEKFRDHVKQALGAEQVAAAH